MKLDAAYRFILADKNSDQILYEAIENGDIYMVRLFTGCLKENMDTKWKNSISYALSSAIQRSTCEDHFEEICKILEEVYRLL